MSQVREIQRLRLEDKFLLVILDACRYDYLSELLEERGYDVPIKPVRTPCTNTHAWARTVWSEQYDINYISAIPYFGNQEMTGPNPGVPTYNASEHFSNVIEAWRIPYADEGPVYPDYMAHVVKHNLSERTVAHFSNPHMPHIGDPPLTPNEVEGASLRRIGPANEVTDEYMRRSYKGDLLRAWIEGVEPILEYIDDDRSIVISADHGECLGEDGNYGHNVDHEKVRIVPWAEIQ